MKYFYLAVSSVVLAYFIIILFVYFYQRNLLYHPSENNYLNDKITFNYEEIFIETDKHIKLKSWFIKKDLNKFKTILIFHGNAGNLFNRVYKLNELNKFWDNSEFSRYWKNHGINKISARTGIHTGSVTAGNIGSNRMLQYSTIGDTVNVASRLEQNNKDFSTDILFSHEIYSSLTKDLKLQSSIWVPSTMINCFGMIYPASANREPSPAIGTTTLYFFTLSQIFGVSLIS